MTVSTSEKADRTLTGGRNCSIDIFRCICALLVILNHADPLWDLNILKLQQLNLTVTNFAVAFFSMTAGFFFTRSLTNGKKALLPYLKRLFIPYALWSLLYFAIEFFSGGAENIVGFVKSCAIRFLLSGSAYHFWYFPAVMISAVITAAFFRCRAEKLLLPLSFAMFAYFVVLLDYSWLFRGAAEAANAPVVYDTITVKRIFFVAFPYFCGGFLVKLLTEKNNFLRRNSTAVLIVSALLYAAEYILLAGKGVMAPTVIFGQYFMSAALLLFLVEHPMPAKLKIAKKCRYFAGLSYYIHPALIMAVDALYGLAFRAAVPSALRFALVCALCAALSETLRKLNNKYLNVISC